MLTLLYPEVWHWHLEYDIIVIALNNRRGKYCSFTTNSPACEGQVAPGEEREEGERGRENEETNGKESGYREREGFFNFLFF